MDSFLSKGTGTVNENIAPFINTLILNLNV